MSSRRAKWFAGFVGVATLLLGGLACQAEPETVKIGMLSPQTGPIAQYAPGFQDAGNVAIAELNATHEDDFVFWATKGDLRIVILLFVTKIRGLPRKKKHVLISLKNMSFDNQKRGLLRKKKTFLVFLKK